MLIQNVLIENAMEASDVRIVDGKFSEIAAHLTPQPDEEVLDGNHKLLLPPFVDPPTFI